MVLKGVTPQGEVKCVGCAKTLEYDKDWESVWWKEGFAWCNECQKGVKGVIKIFPVTLTELAYEKVEKAARKLGLDTTEYILNNLVNTTDAINSDNVKDYILNKIINTLQ